MVDDAVLAELRREAHNGAPQALFQLASALVRRQEVEEAFVLHRRAAEAGLANAQIEYARMMLYGVGADADPEHAAGWLLRAEAAGSPIASYFLALMALGEVALPRDGRINDRLMAAVRADYPPAVRAAAVHFGRRPYEANQALCMQLLERAAGHGDVVSARLLIERLARGEGCEPQPAAARELQAQLARRGIGRLPHIEAATPVASGLAPGALALEEAWLPVAAHEHHPNPRIITVDNLLSADECRLLVANAEAHLQRSKAVDPDSGTAEAMGLRTSSDASIDPIIEDLALRLVQLRMARAANLPLSHAEHLTVLQYEPGQEYRPHRDYLPSSTVAREGMRSGNRLRTICVYLNEVEAGGETEFPIAGVKVTPKAGRAVIFDNLRNDGSPEPDSLHAGLPVQRGQKWLATLWLRQAPYRTF